MILCICFLRFTLFCLDFHYKHDFHKVKVHIDYISANGYTTSEKQEPILKNLISLNCEKL